ncbi:MAG: cytochrome c oxidase accessory protein CcoG [Minwuiales bacterium]|nr:cytochrome c oxidase accessory protein CcoG [Minwuiales bacterium]
MEHSPGIADSALSQPLVETVDVQPVNKQERRELYKKRQKIFPKRVQGTFRSLKWVIMAITLGIYYLAPWIRWDRGPNAPDQAILIDFPARRFYFFFIEIWPQEVYYLTGLLILAALALFLITSLAGRVWCGYTCPQTVWTDLFILVERMVEGDRNARMRLDKARWTVNKFVRRVIKHGIWVVIAVATGGAWVFYFADAPTLLPQLFTLQAPAVSYIFIGVLSLTTYLLGGLAREQVCTYMCPWPRIQGALLDEESLVVSYRADRGEPRGAHKKGQSWEGRGDCIDCNQCVAVCPMGIDIRDGLQLECISCALCIDACNTVMDKVGRPRGLITYDTYTNSQRRERGEPARIKLLRPRTIVYGSVIVVVGLVMLATLIQRPTLEANVLRDRNPLFVTLSDGSIRNGYTVKILNKLHETRSYGLTLEGLSEPKIAVVGQQDAGDAARFTVKPNSLGSFRVFVTVPTAAVTDPSVPVTFVVTDESDGTVATNDTSFRGPDR